MALFLLTKATLAYLPTALSVALKPLFPFRLAQFAQIFPLTPASFSTLSAVLGSINKPATSLLLLSDCCSVLATLSSPPTQSCFYLKLSGRFGRNCFLFPVLSGFNRSPDTRFSRGTTRLMSWPDGERYSCPLQSLVVSFLLSLVSTFLGIEAYCLIEICRQTGSLVLH